MAEARRCDRCNEYYMLNEDIKERGEYPITADFKKQIYSLSIYDNNNSRITHKDLCPKCSRSLIVWLNDYGDLEKENDIPNPNYTQLLESGFGECPFFTCESSGLMCRQSSTCDKPCKSVELYKMQAENENEEKPEAKEVDVRDNIICKTCKFRSIPIFERPCSVCNNYDMYSAQVAIAKAEEVLKDVLNVAEVKEDSE